MLVKKDRVIIDTNLWISFLLTKEFYNLDSLFSPPIVTLIFSQELLEEFLEVASRPKFKKYFTLMDLEELLIQMQEHAEFVEVISQVELYRDQKDNFLLALAKDGKADYLITGDKDLLEIGQLENTPIITISQFLKLKSEKK
jgi:putative PIN family toxin of toxin-antitoxin system